MTSAVTASTSLEKLVTTEWVADRIGSADLILVESNEDPLLYPSGHIEGAFEIDWVRDLNDPVRRDYLDNEQFAKLLSKIGYRSDAQVVFYGDRSNWWAAYALWVFQLFGITNTYLMDGGRLKWMKEGRPLVLGSPLAEPQPVSVAPRDDLQQRILRDELLKLVPYSPQLVDVRSPEEFTGQRLHMPDFPNEGAMRGGHIPGAKNVPWAKAVDPETGCFKSLKELQALYHETAGLDPDQEVLVYCRIGERSSHTWFVLKHILGFPNVRNYDGSWTEYGNLVGVPIEK